MKGNFNREARYDNRRSVGGKGNGLLIGGPLGIGYAAEQAMPGLGLLVTILAYAGSAYLRVAFFMGSFDPRDWMRIGKGMVGGLFGRKNKNNEQSQPPAP